MNSKTKFQLIFISILILMSLAGCSPNSQNKPETISNTDTMEYNLIHSFAVPSVAAITHLNWQAKVDFDRKLITGKATYAITKTKQAEQLILDTQDLEIHQVTLNNDEPASYTLDHSRSNEFLGTPLVIDLKENTGKVSITYTTSNRAEALQWLDPQQTAQATNPFLFTQSQAILARSWIPIQDSPGIRFTYQAEVEVPPGLMALMSAENPREISPDGRYSFKMDQPIPAYLMALAVGELEFQSVGDRTGVYAEPALIEESAYEFAEMEEMLVKAEQLYGPYQWERYDLIVLPPSFPFGGMENPRITFVTPTILAGDRSLTSLVAHELAHSWSGNLVTNATWNDFWLNEGFTVYFERRIMEAMYGSSYAEMLAELGYQDLKGTVDELKEEGNYEDTKLFLNLEGRNPDDGMTDIAYEKGYFFLRLLENKVGRDKFDAFLNQYFEENAFSTMTTNTFIAYLNQNLFEANQMEIPQELYQQWIYGTGLPANFPEVDSDRFDQVDLALQKYQSGVPAAELSTQNWSSHEWLHFIRMLPEDINLTQMKELDQAFAFTQTGNSELLVAWLIHGVKQNYQQSFQRLEEFLIKTGRRKFLVPLYKELSKSDEGKQLAMRIYQKARDNYHYVSVNTLDEMLGWEA